MADAASSPLPTPSSAYLREAARRLATLEADGIYDENDAAAVAYVATWLLAIANRADAETAKAIVARMLGRAT